MDAERLVTLKIDARRGHNNVHDCDELLSLLTLAERYLWLRDKAPYADIGTPFVAIVHGDGLNNMDGSDLDAAIDAARKGGD